MKTLCQLTEPRTWLNALRYAGRRRFSCFACCKDAALALLAWRSRGMLLPGRLHCRLCSPLPVAARERFSLGNAPPWHAPLSPGFACQSVSCTGAWLAILIPPVTNTLSSSHRVHGPALPCEKRRGRSSGRRRARTIGPMESRKVSSAPPRPRRLLALCNQAQSTIHFHLALCDSTRSSLSSTAARSRPETSAWRRRNGATPSVLTASTARTWTCQWHAHGQAFNKRPSCERKRAARLLFHPARALVGFPPFYFRRLC